MSFESELRDFLAELCHPEGYGHAVTPEVRRRARELLNRWDSQGQGREAARSEDH